MRLLTLLACSVLLTSLATLAQPPDTLWTRAFDFSQQQEWPNAAAATQEGGWILSGAWMGFAYLICIDADGSVLWSRAGGHAWDILCMNDGGFLMAGSYLTGPDEFGYLIRTNAQGDTLWTGGSGLDMGIMGIDVDTVGNAIFELCGSPYWGAEFTLAKFSMEGDTIWTRGINTQCVEDAVGGVAATADGGCAVLLTVMASPTFYVGRPSLYRFDAEGELLWTYTHADSQFASLTNLVALPTGEFVFAGTQWNADSLYRISAFGTFQSAHALPNLGHAYRLASEGQSGFAVLCFDGLVRVSLDGTVLWSDTLFGDPWEHDQRVLALAPDGGFLVVTRRHDDPADIDTSSTYLIRLATDLEAVDHPDAGALPESISLTTYPNPFNATTTISFSLPQASPARLSLCDLMGREVEVMLDGNLPGGEQRISFEASHLPSGVYFLHLNAQHSSLTHKLLLLK